MMMQENFGGTVRNCVRGGPDHLVILETSADSGNRSQTTRRPAPRQSLNGPWGDLSSFTLWKPQGSPPFNSFLEV